MKELDAKTATLRVPARPEWIHVARAVAAGVAARVDFTVDAIEDLKIAVDEACTYLLSERGGTSLEVQMTPRGTALEVVALVDSDTEGWPPAAYQGSLIWQVLSGLTDEAALTSDGKPAVRLVKRGRGN